MGRKQKKYHYIYKTVNLLSGKYYIGMHSTDDLNDGYLGSGTRLRRSINKHGKGNHKLEILEFCETRELLKQREEEVVTLNEIAKIDCMNLKVGGYGGFISDEQQTYRSACAVKARIKKGLEDPEWLEEYKKKLSDAIKKRHKNGQAISINQLYNWNGKKHSEETKNKISKTKKGKGYGKTNSQFGSCWITNGFENKKIMKGGLLPDGWKLGRKVKIKDEK